MNDTATPNVPAALRRFHIMKFHVPRTGGKGYVPALNGQPLTQKGFKSRRLAQQFLDELQAAIAERERAQQQPAVQEVTAAEVEAAFTSQHA